MLKYLFKILRKNSLLFGFGLILISCSEFFVPDISDHIPILIIPGQQDTIVNNSIHFKWTEMEGADSYKLEVVSPSFASISEFPLDSAIEGTEFFYTLDPGVYEYRIKAINSAFESEYSEIRSFVIDSTSDLSSLSLLLTSPADAFYTNETSPTFVWQDLYPADIYELEIRQGTNWFTATSIETGNSLSSFYTLSASLSEGNYLWQVTASNALPSSTSSNQRILYVDLTNPGIPSLLAPSDLASFADTVNFSWNSGSDNGGTVNSPRYDSLYIFSDSLNPFNSEISRIYSTNETAQYVFQSSSSSYFYWRVRTLDEAGNKGNFSTIRRITIQ